MGLEDFNSTNRGGTEKSWNVKLIEANLIKLYENEGNVNEKMINDSDILPSGNTVRSYFGSLNNAYDNAGIPRNENITIKLSDTQTSVIEGELLGDGSISKEYNSTFKVTDKHYKYCNWIREIFPDTMFTENSIHEKEEQSDNTYTVQSRYLVNLNSYRNSWYKEGNKCLPDSFKLDSIKLLHWYLGDGYLNGGSPCLSGTWLSVDSAKRLKESIESKAKVQCTLSAHSERRVIRVKLKDKANFFSYIGRCPIQCYKYKWGNS